MKIVGYSSVLLGSIIILAATIAAAAQDGNGGNSDISKLIVQGEGKVTAAPDRAIIRLGAETRDSSAVKAASDNARIMNQTIAALLDTGIAKSEIQTSGYSLTAQQEEPLSEEGTATKPKAIQFVAKNTVTVSLNNTSDVGRVLDAAVFTGSNTIQEVSFDLKDDGQEKDQALTLAIEDASHKANVAAQAAGVNLGRVLEISESYGYVSAASGTRSIMYDATTPIQPGLMEITASVTMTYEITEA